MSRLIYIDTNVYIDYFKERSYGLRPANEFAFSLIQRTINCEFKIIVSTKLILELERYIKKETFLGLFDELRIYDKILDVKITNEIKNLAEELSNTGKIHHSDALHYAFAFYAGA